MSAAAKDAAKQLGVSRKELYDVAMQVCVLRVRDEGGFVNGEVSKPDSKKCLQLFHDAKYGELAMSLFQECLLPQTQSVLTMYKQP